MLQAQNLHKSYGLATVLAGATFIINDGEHVGLIGPNGSGKSTLLRLLTGQEQPDQGTIVLSPRDSSIGYLPQALPDPGSLTVGQMARAAQADLLEAEEALQRAAEALGSEYAGDGAMERYNAALAAFEALRGYEREHKAAAVLQGLGLGEVDQDTPVASLSGGQKTRLGLATLLLRDPDLLLLDEPTNHLDVEALEWLEGFVRGYRGAVLVVSHDREFLDGTVERTLYLDPVSKTLRSYAGNYSDFAAARAREREAHQETWRRQQEYVERVSSGVARMKSEALATELSTTPRQPGVRKLARKKAQMAKSREHKLERYLESDERVEKPKTDWWLKMDFGPAPPGGRAVLRMENVTFAYPQGNPILTDASLDVRYGERVALVGPNGAGKTTLLRLIEGALEPSSGLMRLGSNVSLGVLSQEQETLDQSRSVLETVREARPMPEADARSFLHFFLFLGDSVFRRVGDCSLGERTRLQLAVLVLKGCNLLLLDEPLNHLDIEGREHFEQALEAFSGTVIVVSHDRAFLHSYPEKVVEVRGGGLRMFEGYDTYLE